MNRLIIMLIAILGMAFAGCSNDDLLDVNDLDDLDKLDKIEKPTIIGYHNVSTALIYENDKNKVNALPEIKEDGEYRVYVFHSAEELAEAQISSNNIPGISFNPGFTKEEYIDFLKECRNQSKSVSVVEDFSDIDWSKQSLVYVLRYYAGSIDMTLVNVTGKVYRKGGEFVINLKNEILFEKGIVCYGTSRCGIAVLIEKTNLSAKDLKIRLDNTEYTIYMNPLEYEASENEKKVESKWLKL